MFAFLCYAVPAVVIAVTGYIGFRGVLFYRDEVLRDPDREA